MKIFNITILFFIITFDEIVLITCGNTSKRSQQINSKPPSINPATGVLEHPIDIYEYGQLQSPSIHRTVHADPDSTTTVTNYQNQNLPYAYEHRIDIPEDYIITELPFEELSQMENQMTVSSSFTENQQKTIAHNSKQNFFDVFEHRISVPEPETFWEQFESSIYASKVNIRQENGSEFLKILSELSLSMNSPKFNRMSVELQLYEIFTKINFTLNQKHDEIGEALIGVINQFAKNCHQIGDDRERKYYNHSKNIAGIKQDLGRKICFLGLFLSLVEFINKEMTEAIEQFTAKKMKWINANRKLRRELGLENGNKNGEKKFLERQNTSKLIELHEFLILYSMSIEQLFNFWTKTKENLINEKYVKNKCNFFLSAKIKKNLSEITRERMNEFVATKIELENM